MHLLVATNYHSLLTVAKQLHGLHGLISMRSLTSSRGWALSMPKVQDIIDTMRTLERFVVLMYDLKSNCLDVNSCRWVIFVKKGRPIDALSPTSAALPQNFTCCLSSWSCLETSRFYLFLRNGAEWKTKKAMFSAVPHSKKHPQPYGNLLDADASPRKVAFEGANA